MRGQFSRGLRWLLSTIVSFDGGLLSLGDRFARLKFCKNVFDLSFINLFGEFHGIKNCYAASHDECK